MVCEHLLDHEPVPPRTLGCEECLKTGSPWELNKWRAGKCDSSCIGRRS
jgi:hypothetical protein